MQGGMIGYLADQRATRLVSYDSIVLLTGWILNVIIFPHA
jgi:hypothetical protein